MSPRRVIVEGVSANSIDEVVARLGDIIEQSIGARDRRGYFAALYSRVTCRVRDGIHAGEFDDNARMERLDVVFANRYLDAYDAYQAGERPTNSWLQSFEAAKQPGLEVLQHLLLGMNTHIHLDLGIAAATVADGTPIDGLKGDFFRINEVLASLVAQVEDEWLRVTQRQHPLFAGAMRFCFGIDHGLERTIADVALDEARDSAWRFAQELASLGAEDRAPSIARRDAQTVLIGQGVLMLQPVVERLEAGHDEDIAANVRTLAEGEPTQ
jgi:hypothetical protein